MRAQATNGIGASGDEPPHFWRNPEGCGPYLLICEHASNWVPERYWDLDYSRGLLASHHGWDPGALALGEALAKLLDAPLIGQKVSRLVYDCNRAPNSPSAILEMAEDCEIGPNIGLNAAERAERTALVYAPFVAHIDRALDARIARGERPVVLTVHSFAPVFRKHARMVQIGLASGRCDAFARAMCEALWARRAPWDVRRNEPYGPEDEVTHTLDARAAPRGLDHAMIAVRSDLLEEAERRCAIAHALAEAAERAREIRDARR